MSIPEPVEVVVPDMRGRLHNGVLSGPAHDDFLETLVNGDSGSSAIKLLKSLTYVWSHPYAEDSSAYG